MSELYNIKDLRYRRSNTFELNVNALTINEHSITGLLGANGSGKTTLLNLLSRQLDPKKGELFFKGKAMHTLKFINDAGIAYVHQSPYLLRGTVEKNLALGLKLKGVNAQNRKQQLEKYLDVLNLEHLLNRPCTEISGGEAQRVAIGRMLVMDMQVLIFDEPFTYLDEASCTELEQLFIRLVKEKQCSIIFSTHDKHRAVAICDQIIKLDKGLLVEADEENILQGNIDPENHLFKSKELSIHIPQSFTKGKRIIIDARQIILSRQLLESSMQNSLPAKITNIETESGEVKVTMNIGNGLVAIITPEALQSMALKIGDAIYASFKTSAVMVY